MKDTVEETKKLIIKEEKLQEMSVRVGILHRGNYLVYVNTDDSVNIPHFHCVDNNTRGQQFHTCIRIDAAEYFCHGNKQDKFNSKELKCLNEFLSTSFIKPKFQGTNWEYIVMIWNMNNSETTVDEDIGMPDYTKLK